jgi:NTE family protein
MSDVEAARQEKRAGLALCLSGGGFRAALFHLGALRRLNELGVLSRVDTLSAVSGGSLFAAHLAERMPLWPEPGEPLPDWDASVAEPFRAFAARNLRTWPLLHRALPANWGRPGTAVDALAGRLHERLVRLALPDLPERPRYVFSATDMVFGVNWIFERTRAGDFQAGYLAPGEEWTLARAAAASSCFPPVFAPMRLDLTPGQLRRGSYRRADRDDLVTHLRLTDGGVYDNMALEPVWKNHGTVLVSDGGAVFDYASSANPVGRLLRYPAIIGKQASAVRRRWLIGGFANGTLAGAYWGIGNVAGGSGNAAGYGRSLVEELVTAIRTDLDAFSGPEIAILENHGYLVADRIVRSRAPQIIAREATLAPPFPDWLGDDTRVRQALRGSDRRTLLGRR